MTEYEELSLARDTRATALDLAITAVEKGGYAKPPSMAMVLAHAAKFEHFLINGKTLETDT